MRGMKAIDVGTYFLGWENVRVRLDPNTDDSEIRVAPNDKGCALMTIGCQRRSWADVCGSLLHEAIEVSLHRLNTAYSPTMRYRNAADRYLFVMTHAEMGEACARVGEFMAVVLPDMSKAFKALKAWKM